MKPFGGGSPQGLGTAARRDGRDTAGWAVPGLPNCHFSANATYRQLTRFCYAERGASRPCPPVHRPGSVNEAWWRLILG